MLQRQYQTGLWVVAALMLRLCAAVPSYTRVWVTAASEPAGPSAWGRGPLYFVVSLPSSKLDLIGTADQKLALTRRIEERTQGLLRTGYACVRIENIQEQPLEERIGCDNDLFISVDFNVVQCATRRKRVLDPTPLKSPLPANLRRKSQTTRSLEAVTAALSRLEEKFSAIGGSLRQHGDQPAGPLIVDARPSPEYSASSIPSLLWLTKQFLASFVFAAALGALSCWSFAYHADLVELCPSTSTHSSKRKKRTSVAVDLDANDQNTRPRQKKNKNKNKNKNKKRRKKKKGKLTANSISLMSKAELRRHELRIRKSVKKLKHFLAEAGPWSMARDHEGMLTLTCRGKIMPIVRAVTLCDMTLESTDDGDFDDF